jgi:hypothetical protein
VINEIEPNDTLDHAQKLPDLSVVGQLQVLGQLGNNTAGGADVDWYSFTLNQASSVQFNVTALSPVSPLKSVLTLYNSDPNDPADYYDPVGHRLLVQQDGATQGGNAHLVWSLAAGTYYAAVSGSGDLYFHPLIAGSGYPGSTGAYDLRLKATSLGLTSSDGPVVLASDPQPGANLSSSPFGLRFDLSSALDPSQIGPQSVQLIENATGQFGQGDQVLSLANWNFSNSANELQLMPAAPLGPGFYEVVLAGLESPGRLVLTDLGGQPLGKDALHPLGQDFALRFQVSGIEGNAGLTTSGDNTAATARPLGDITHAGLVQVNGAIGNDPTDLVPFDASDVDLYRFQISGSGTYALTAEVFAGRIGSPLMPAVSLLQYDAASNVFHILQANAGTQNQTLTHDGSSVPLASDPEFTAALTPGVYYLAVTDAGNAPFPDPAGLPLVMFDNFDPVAAQQSGMGFSTGNYVLNLQVTPDNDPPQVTSVTLANGTPLRQGAVLSTPPSQVNVTFSEPVSLLQLLQGTEIETGTNALQAAYIQGGSNQYYLGLDSVDNGGRAAHFILYDRLPGGSYQLHLSGAAGLTDLGGNPLLGNQPGGDFVLSFTVAGPTLGPSREDVEPNDSPAQAQNLGVLFPIELVNGIQIARDAQSLANSQSTDTADYFSFTVLQTKTYGFILNNTGSVSGLQVSISGASLSGWLSLKFFGAFASEQLDPGTYLLRVGGWSAQQRLNVTYQLEISIGQAADLPPPLTQGAAPAIQIRRVTGTAPVSPSPPLPAPPALPPAGGNVTLPVSLGAAPNSSGSSSSNDIPVGVLAALAAGPLTGLDAFDPAAKPEPSVNGYGQALALAPGILAPELLLPLPILLPVQDPGPSSSGPLALLGDLVRDLDKIDWAWAVEYLHSIVNRLSLPQVLLQPVDNGAPPEEPLEDSEGVDASASTRSLENDASMRSPASAGLASLALFLIPALAVTGQSPSATEEKSRRVFGLDHL